MLAYENSLQKEKILGSNPRINILNTSIDVLDEHQTVELVEKYVISKEPLHLVGVNADKINSLNSNLRLAKIVNSCGIINADGASVVLASKFLNTPLPERVAGIDLMQSLIKLSADKNYSVYLLGAKQTVVEKTAEVLEAQYPALNIVGLHDGYFEESDWPSIAEELNNITPDFIFVGITSPIKEYLVEFLQSKGNKGVFMGVGGSFDVISGKIPRAPKWMQMMNLEWLYRVFKEPKRLFKRYLFGNFSFIKLIIREKIYNR